MMIRILVTGLGCASRLLPFMVVRRWRRLRVVCRFVCLVRLMLNRLWLVRNWAVGRWDRCNAMLKCRVIGRLLLVLVTRMVREYLVGSASRVGVVVDFWGR